MSLSISELFSVRGKVALVTGGASGIGRMIAQGLAENGAEVYIASRKLESCQAAADELSAFGPCTALQVDVAEMESLQRLAADVQERTSKLHILVNNSGTGWAEPFEQYQAKGWDKVFDVNVKAPFFLIKELLPALQAAATPDDPARVINIGSVAGLHYQHSTNNFAYGISKAAVHHLSMMLGGMLGASNITVNAVAPGPFPSRMMQGSGLLAQLTATVPLGRAGTDEDAAGTVLFLSSRAGAFVNGVVLPLDGGRVVNTFND